MNNMDTNKHDCPKPKVFLVHGIFMHGFIMQYMHRKLEQYGYEVYSFSYQSVHRKLSENASLFVDFIQQHATNDDVVHCIGHSLGGLLIRHAYEQAPELFTGRIVTAGTPHNGSEVARRVVADLHRAIIGGAFDDGLDGCVPHWNGHCELGSIAGDTCIGVGYIFNTLEKPHDGTVAVAETILQNQKDHVVVSSSHTMLVYSSTVIEQIDNFLRYGRFIHTQQ